MMSPSFASGFKSFLLFIAFFLPGSVADKELLNCFDRQAGRGITNLNPIAELWHVNPYDCLHWCIMTAGNNGVCCEAVVYHKEYYTCQLYSQDGRQAPALTIPAINHDLYVRSNNGGNCGRCARVPITTTPPTTPTPSTTTPSTTTPTTTTTTTTASTTTATTPTTTGLACGPDKLTAYIVVPDASILRRRKRFVSLMDQYDFDWSHVRSHPNMEDYEWFRAMKDSDLNASQPFDSYKSKEKELVRKRRQANSIVVIPDVENTFCTLACTDNITANGVPFTCRSTNYDLNTRTCILNGEKAKPDGIRDLQPKDEDIYAEKICLSRPHNNCVLDEIFPGFPDSLPLGVTPGQTINTPTLQDCVDKCVNQLSFVCRSIGYNIETRECLQFKVDTTPQGGSATLSGRPGFYYVENGCLINLTGTTTPVAPTSDQCPPDVLTAYLAFPEAESTLGGAVITGISDTFCALQCTENINPETNRPYQCQSYSYDTATRTCTLHPREAGPDGDDSLIASFDSIYSEKMCLRNPPRTCRPDEVFVVAEGETPPFNFDELQLTSASSLEACAVLCINTPGCLSSSFNRGASSCRLFDVSTAPQGGFIELELDPEETYVENGCAIGTVPRAAVRKSDRSLFVAPKKRVWERVEPKRFSFQDDVAPWGPWTACNYKIGKEAAKVRTRKCNPLDCPPGSLQLKRCYNPRIKNERDWFS